ncbi:hypothetical protein FRC12_021477 [Ceratobasidium sp. 428]|nr:hypothetical protein FRC12_021477 [Ceratobasidium sp. 428]
MSTTDDSIKHLDVSGLKLRNSERSINRLPSELLLRIFEVGDEEQRATRNEGEPYYGFQDLVTQVCTHWHDVATNAPALWTYIYISRPPPHHSAALYLDRCGPAALLDIYLEMSDKFGPYPGAIDAPRLRQWRRDMIHDMRIRPTTKDTIESLIQYGAITSRWKSLSIRSRDSRMLYQALKYVHPQSTPVLQYLSVECSLQAYFATTFLAENESENNAYPTPSGLFSRLRHIELITLPAGFLLKRLLPMLAGLTRLKLSSEVKLYSRAQLCDMLSANSQLESLDISGCIIDEDFEPTDRRVVLPTLRSLSIASEESCAWTLGIMKMINGPAVEHLKLSHYGYQLPDEIIQVIEQISLPKAD